jgi:hypothetical protein
MRRPLTAAVALLTVAGLAAVPASAATRKPPKPIKGSYTVTLPPDPSGNVDGQGCAGQIPVSQDQHAFTIPAKGRLTLHLSSEDPTGQAFDWDLALLDEGGSVLNTSTGATAEEEILMKFKKKERVLFQACNLAGLPQATVTYTFTYS